jgi:hypothetical protein
MTGRLAEGLYVGRPWARVWRFNSGWEDAHIEVLPQDPRPIGVQGVYAVSPEEDASSPDRPIEPLLDSLGEQSRGAPATQLASIRAFYRSWTRENGVVAGQLRPLHPELFGWLARSAASVIVSDLFHESEPGHEFEVAGFASWEAAVEYARRRVRDSLEEVRAPAQSGDALRAMWRSFGEDARVVEERGGRVYVASKEMDAFIAHPASPRERDWVSLTPGF